MLLSALFSGGFGPASTVMGKGRGACVPAHETFTQSKSMTIWPAELPKQLRRWYRGVVIKIEQQRKMLILLQILSYSQLVLEEVSGLVQMEQRCVSGSGGGVPGGSWDS